MSLDLAGAATLEIGRLPQPVLTEYELGRLLFDLYDKKQVEGLKIGRLKKSVPDIGDFGSLLRTLLNRGILRKRRDFRGSVQYFGEDPVHARRHFVLGGSVCLSFTSECDGLSWADQSNSHHHFL